MMKFHSMNIGAHKCRRVFALVLSGAIVITTACLPSRIAFSATANAPPPINGLTTRPDEINLNNSRGLTAVSFRHETPGAPPALGATPPYINPNYTGRAVRYTLSEHAKGYRAKPADRILDDRRSEPWPADNSPFLVEGLPSGSIFDVSATNFTQYVEYTQGQNGQNGQSRNGESAESASVRGASFFTGVQIAAAATAQNQVRLTWDDVWYDNARVYGYALNVYSNSAATTPENTTSFAQGQIGAGQPISVNESTGKLEYVYAPPYPGRVYSFEIAPNLANAPGVIEPRDRARVTVASSMLVTATKLYEEDNNITWELKWSNVTAGMGGTSNARYTAEYSVARIGGGAAYSLLQKINNDTSTVVVTPKDPAAPENQNAMYEITAKVFENGQEMYVDENITITTGPFALKETEPPHTPQAPGLKLDTVRSPSAVGATDGSADIWWRIPGLVTDPNIEDRDVSYEMHVFDNPADLNVIIDNDKTNDPAPTYELDGRALTTAQFDGETGYRYTVPNLIANKTYYVAMVAAKMFVDPVTMQAARYASAASYISFTTEPALPGGTPPAPTTLALVDGSVTPSAMSFTAGTNWHERFNAATGMWEPCEPQFTPDGSAAPDTAEYRTLKYEPGDSLTLYYAEYLTGTDIDNPESITGYTTAPFRILAIGDATPANVDATPLRPNTTYVFWARASRGTTFSYPSKVIVATTPPDPNVDIGEPTTPDFEFVYIGDTFVDLSWIKKPDHRYTIQVSLTDWGAGGADAGTGTNTIEFKTSTALIEESGIDSYRTSGLSPDTQYYFRIQAEVTSPLNGAIKTSVWSDSKPARTRPPAPPETPTGFGVKPGQASVTKNSINYEWLALSGLTYYIEYCEDENLVGSAEQNSGTAGDYILTGLLSNHRYYARLYAYDQVTGLRSKPTYIVGVRTLRSGDDYDSSVDTTQPLGGEYVKKNASAERGVWRLRVSGTDADRLSDRVFKDNMTDYEIDLRSLPRNTLAISLTVEGKLMESFGAMSERLALRLPDKTILIRPNTLLPSLAGPAAARAAAAGPASAAFAPVGAAASGAASSLGALEPRGYSYEILLRLSGEDAPGEPGGFYKEPRGFSTKSQPTGIEARVVAGAKKYPVFSFRKPVGIVIPFSDAAWYDSGRTTGAALYAPESGDVSDGDAWEAVKAGVSYDQDEGKGTLSFDCASPGYVMAANYAARRLFTDVDGSKYASEVNRLGTLGVTDARLGEAFRPSDPVTAREALSMLYNVAAYSRVGGGASEAGSGARTGVGAGASDLAALAKSGMIRDPLSATLALDESLALVGRAYATQTGAAISVQSGGGSTEMAAIENASAFANADSVIGAYAKLARDNGLAAGVSDSASAASDARAVTRAEFAALLGALIDALN